MRIKLPNGEKTTLDEHISIEEKIEIVNNLLDEWLSTLIMSWHSDTTKFFLDNLANYLVWHKEREDVGYQDKEVLSVKRIEEMSGKRKGKSTPFTSLSKPQRELLFGDVRGAENEQKEIN